MELLQSHQDLNERDPSNGLPILHYSIENQNYEIMEFLLLPPGNINLAADPNLHDLNGIPPLFKAIEILSLKAVKLLLNAGAEINYKQNKTKDTALHLAITYNSLEIIEELLESSEINVNACSKNKENGLMLSINMCNLEIFEVLLRDKRIDILRRDSEGNSVFHIALDVGAVSII